jgi:asparagine synthase (glutamine-hydrolysing)
MCGITGQFNFQRREPVERGTIVRMADSIAHRGPDDEGYFVAGPVGLGFRRLSIIDLAGGHQPMSDIDETVWVIFNGEIYNYRELRAQLQDRGYQFRTNSDTEVIVHGYKEWGADVLNHLNGMFGLAIWDVTKERLVVARDAMGIKLIYYRLQNGQLTFGSEIRAVRAADEAATEVDPEAASLFLRFRYTPAPLTIFKGIRKLAPGTMLVVEKGQCREERWYNFVPTPFPTEKKDDEAVEELLQLYREAVHRHLLSDVPVGILLSGGLDSGLLLGLMSEGGQKWPAYTVGYGDSFEDDEIRDAAETAALFGGEHIPVLLDRAEFERSLPRIVESLEEPVTSSSIVPMYFVSKRARQDVKVVIIGQGPDELFGGYKRHVGVHYGNFWRALPAPARTVGEAAINRLPRNEMLKRGVASLAVGGRLERYEQVFSLAPRRAIEGLFAEGILSPGNGKRCSDSWEAILAQGEQCDELGAFQLLELRSSLPDELLMFADKLSMAHGLEGRLPYLDKTVVEYVQRLGENFKIRWGTRKWLHRRVCRSYLPARILKRRKRGFAVNVVDEWFATSLNNRLSDLLLDPDSLMFEMLDPVHVRRLLEEHRARRSDNYKLLFSLVVLEQWLRGIESNRGGPPRSRIAARVSR